MTAAYKIISDDPALDEGELVTLARRCWEADGGLPLAVEPWFVRSRWSRPGTKTFTVRALTPEAAAEPGSALGDAPVASPSSGGAAVASAFSGDAAVASAFSGDAAVASAFSGDAAGHGSFLEDAAEGGASSGDTAGRGPFLEDAAEGSGDAGALPGTGDVAGGMLLAAIAVRPGPRGPMVTGLVDPAARGRGIGSRLLDAALAVAAEFEVATAGFVTVETEGLSADAEKLFQSRGLRQFFAEEVMRIDLAAAPVPGPAWPAGTTVAEWNGKTAERFFQVYAASFRERPGYPDPSAAEWIEDTAEDDDFQPERSLLATLPEIGDAGFVSVGDNWIQQVGVVPAARRTGLGGALIREALRRMASAGLHEGWLCVNVDNPAASLYRRIGFEGAGHRARYRPIDS
jgi:mycothiol synthase